MCLDDSCWENVFSESELQEIINEGSRSFPSVSKNIQDILDRFQQAADLICENNKYETYDQKLNGLMLNAMVDELLEIGLFDIRIHFDSKDDVFDSEDEESWVISTINQPLSYYVNELIAVMGNNISELDLVTKFWCYFDRCFDDLRINTTRDRACMATALRVNEGRKVTGTDEIDNKKKSIRPDLLLVKDDVEYGCSEVGKSDNVIPTKKEIIETDLHCPKTMKDILNRVASLVDYDEEIIKKLRFVCFHQTNRRMKLSLIDCPRGYICRVMESDEYDIPAQARLFPAQVHSLIKLMLQAKVIIKQLTGPGIVSETMQSLTRYQMSKKGEVGLRRQSQKEKKASTIVLPSSLNFTSNNLKRKRKIQD
ncbi:hypothetical protein INT45_006076 [Circinella minor]|uniref:Uncharacterized protein n=1 Tax=Circinella minor TaxID=1195481 RepID=A0A8H7VK13_9FUNG|nr:hypothetical protein INT45_006076 [Circinella minor]